MDLTCLVLGAIFLIAGLAFASGKLHTHMAAWKNMPEEEKAQINIVPLCRNIGYIIAISGVIFLLKGFFSDYIGQYFVWAMIVWLIIAGIDVWRIEKSNRYINQ